MMPHLSCIVQAPVFAGIFVGTFCSLGERPTFSSVTLGLLAGLTDPRLDCPSSLFPIISRTQPNLPGSSATGIPVIFLHIVVKSSCSTDLNVM